jgi:hypothetical protein
MVDAALVKSGIRGYKPSVIVIYGYRHGLLPLHFSGAALLRVWL